MSKDKGKKKSELKQKQAPATKQKQQIKPTELTDADLEKVSGGGAQPHMIGTTDFHKIGADLYKVDASIKFLKTSLK